MNDNYTFGYDNTKVNESSVIKNIFLWMGAGLALTGFIAQGLFTSGMAYKVAISGIMLPLFIAEIALVFILSRNIMKFKATTAILMFLSYSALNGVTLSSIFLAYTRDSIASTFFIAAIMFGVMGFYGYTTKKDLTKMGTYLMMGLIGIVIASVVNFFFRSSGMSFIISFIGVIIFTGLTAYDVQKFSKISKELGNGSTELAMKVSIIGALNLYLDFINMFLFLLRFTGRRR